MPGEKKAALASSLEIHLWVDPAISVYEGHQIGHKVKDQIMASEGLVQDVTVHIEPAAPEMKPALLVAD